MRARLTHKGRTLLLTAVSVLLAAPSALAQTATAQVSATTPAFDVVAIRPNNSGSQGVSWGVNGTGYSASNAPLARVILDAYLNNPLAGSIGYPVDRVKGAPAWVIDTRYDITAKADASTIAEMKGMNKGQQTEFEAPMLQAMLQDRFKLVAHTAPVEVQGYALVVGKHGLKMKETPPGEPLPANGMSFGGAWKMVGRRTADGKQSGIAYVQITMAELAAFLSRGGTPVVDQTGLTGRYDVELQFADDMISSSPADMPAPQRDIAHEYDWSALGLEMKSIKAPVFSVVIDHIERPSEN
jgi:uncharacterized protein (TIGR03435 family)